MRTRYGSCAATGGDIGIGGAVGSTTAVSLPATAKPIACPCSMCVSVDSPIPTLLESSRWLMPRADMKPRTRVRSTSAEAGSIALVLGIVDSDLLEDEVDRLARPFLRESVCVAWRLIRCRRGERRRFENAHARP